MSNKFNGFTVPSNMNPKIEQPNRDTQTAEQVSGNNFEVGYSTTKSVEREPIHIPYEDNNTKVSKDPTPQSYSAMQEGFVEDKGQLTVATNDFGGLLNQKSGGSYSLDIRRASSN